MDENQRSLVIDWMQSVGDQKRVEGQIRNRLNHDPQFRHVYYTFVIECCELAFKPTNKTRMGENVHGNIEWAAGIVVLQVPRDILLSAIVPQLDPGKRLDGILEGQDRDLAEYLEFQATNASPVCFQVYENYLRDHKSEPPTGLIAYMIHKCPEKAFHCLMDIFPDTGNDAKKWLWAEHVIGNTLWKQKYGFVGEHDSDVEPIAQIDVLSKISHWWIRLYAAEIMRQHAEFRQMAIIERLKQDEHPLVRKAIMSFAKTPVPSGGNEK